MYVLPGALAPLGAYRQFILVQLLPAMDERGNPVPGKSVKHPINPQTLLRHSAHDPAIWMGWEEAARLAASLPVHIGTVGWCIGFVITANDPFGCIDLDGCATLHGGWNDQAVEIMRRMPGAYELSLSGVGLHGWFTYGGKCPPHGKRKGILNIEMYTELRFIALGSSASGTMHDLTAQLPQFIADYFPYDDSIDTGAGWTTEPDPEYSHLTDEEILRIALGSSRRQSAEAVFGDRPPMPTFSDLWAANVEVLARAYPPLSPGKPFGQTEADLALAKELAYWTGKNCERVAHLMQQSALKRDKWLPSVHKTYFRDTVIKGVAFCGAVFKSKPILPEARPVPTGEKLEPQAITHETIVGRENLAILFAGCVYIQDQNAMLLPNGDIVDQQRFNAKFAGYTFVMDAQGQKMGKSAWDAFLGNQLIHFPRVEGTEFNPRMEFQAVIERAGRHWVNVYKAPIVDRAPGDVQPFMTLLRKLLPNGDDALILLSYMAAVVQYPGVKFRWAPFIQGTQGNGKSTLVECLTHAIGHKYVFPVKAGMIENGFNSWLENNILYVADDIYSSRDRTDMMEALKSLITQRDHSITLKGIDSIKKRICGNFLFTDNHKDAMKKQDDSRRICTLYCAQQSKWDRNRDGLTKEFFGSYFYPWLEKGGYAHVSDLLATMVIDARYNPAGDCQEAPETSVTREAIIDGRTNVEHEVAEWIELGEPGFCGDFVSHHMLKERMLKNPMFAKSATPLKIKEMMGRLGYEMHRGLPDGRSPTFVQPDGTRPIIYVKRDVWQANITDAESIMVLYVQAQQEAMTQQTARLFGGTP
jgi:hypothetical protein